MLPQLLAQSRLLRFVCLGLLLLLVSPLRASADFTGKVKDVDGGDTIIVLHDGRDEHVRFM